MKRKVISVILSLVLLLSLQTNVFAAGYTMESEGNNTNEIILSSVYGLEDELYVFTNPNDRNMNTLKVALQIDSTHAGQSAVPVSILDHDELVRYMFVIDLSGSMSNVKKNVAQAIESVLDTDACNAVVTLATFGEKFQVVLENGVDKETILQEVDKLKYNENWTNPYTGLLSAYAYLETQPRMPGELINIVLITDGVPAIREEDQKKLEDDKIDVAARITETSSVILHTIGLGNWDKEAYQIFSEGTGVDVSTKDGSAKKCGQKMADFVNRLYVLNYDISQFEDLKTFDVSLTITDSANTTLIQQTGWKQVEVLGAAYVPNAGFELNPEGTGNVDNADDAENIEDTEDTEKNQNTESSENSEEIDDGSETAEKDGENQKGISPIIFIIGGIVIVLAVVIIVVVMQKKRAAGTNSVAAKENVVQMKLVMISGTCSNKTDVVYLQKELFIGSSKKCDIILTESDISPQHSRIYFEGGVVYIEDLHTQTGTYIDGMRIHAANRLRSGDVISVGNTSFKLLF